MSFFEEFVAYAEALPEQRRLEIEEILAGIMDSDDPVFEFTAVEIAELDRRVADDSEESIDGEVIRAKLRALRG